MDDFNDIYFDFGRDLQLGDVQWTPHLATSDQAVPCQPMPQALVARVPAVGPDHCHDSASAGQLQEIVPASMQAAATSFLDATPSKYTYSRTELSQDSYALSMVDSHQQVPQPASLPTELLRLPHKVSVKPGHRDVHEDSDTSWNEADDDDHWCTVLRQQLRQFSESDDWTYTTVPLPGRKRRQVHAMANLWGLSHMSLECNHAKRVLVSKCSLINTSTKDTQRRWGPSRDNWASGCIDPRLVSFHKTSSFDADFSEWLATLGDLKPEKCTSDKSNSTIFALFETASDAELAMRTANNRQPPWDSCFYRGLVNCCYVYFPETFILVPDLYPVHFSELPVRLSAADRSEITPEKSQTQSLKSPPQAAPAETSHPQNDSTPADLAKALAAFDRPPISRVASPSRAAHPPISYHNFSSQASLPRRPSRRSSASREREQGYTSASSQVDSDYSNTTNTSKKRRREKMIKNGYPCSFASSGCTKVFDHDGERRKHEKHHNGNREHTCNVCLKGFLYPKDLRRHMKSHPDSSPTAEPFASAVNTDVVDVSDLEPDWNAYLEDHCNGRLAQARVFNVLDWSQFDSGIDAVAVDDNTAMAIGIYR